MTDRVAIVGAGIGGLVAAAILARQGLDVTVVERQAEVGGKLRTAGPAERPIDIGPTVLTMRPLLEMLCDEMGLDLEAALGLQPASVIARHAWPDGTRLDLYADRERSEDAVATAFGGDEAARFRRFAGAARATFDALDDSFMRAEAPSLLRLVAAPGRLSRLSAIRPFASLWAVLGEHFAEPRLRQLFARYATYCGSSPFSSPSTLMLVAHVEMAGVWLVPGGMSRIAAAFRAAAERNGAVFRLGVGVRSIAVAGGRPAGLVLDDGERIGADTVVFNGDVAALETALLGKDAARAVRRRGSPRSLSAIVLAGEATVEGMGLARHTVFFGRDPHDEFAALFARGAIASEPTVYLCAQDRDGPGDVAAGGERLMLLVNAPADGDRHHYGEAEVARCESEAMALLARSGCRIRWRRPPQVTTPSDFSALFPATGGALYGAACHGAMAAFRRPSARSRMPGLYLAGGSIHPGPGLPMAALSGAMAASALLRDRASTSRFRPAATPGGISTPGAMTAGTG